MGQLHSGEINFERQPGAGDREQSVYRELLTYLSTPRDEKNVIQVTFPSLVDTYYESRVPEPSFPRGISILFPVRIRMGCLRRHYGNNNDRRDKN
jgi:hypothetical protein